MAQNGGWLAYAVDQWGMGEKERDEGKAFDREKSPQH